MTRVVLFGPTPPPTGGVAVHLIRLEDALARQGIAARVVPVTDSGMPQLGVPDNALGRRVGYSALGFVARDGVLHDHSPLIAYPTSYGLGRLLRWARAFRVRRIVTLHDGTVPERMAGLPTPDQTLFWEAVTSAAAVI